VDEDADSVIVEKVLYHSVDLAIDNETEDAVDDVSTTDDELFGYEQPCALGTDRRLLRLQPSQIHSWRSSQNAGSRSRGGKRYKIIQAELK